jgi:RNA polymerase sigma-70 factor (ECF subfamily)
MNNASSTARSTDEELASKVAAGSRASFEALIQRYSSRLFYFLRHKTSSDQDIEDLIQETFLKAYQHINRFDPDKKFSTWLYTIAIRLAISHHRAKKETRPSLVAKSSFPGPQEALIQKEKARNIWNLARSLKQEEYQALWLRYGEDMSIKDMARIMGKKHISVRVLLHRSRLNLAKTLSQSSTSRKLADPSAAEHNLSFL